MGKKLSGAAKRKKKKENEEAIEFGRHECSSGKKKA